jgi:UDP-glucose 4-epimerase
MTGASGFIGRGLAMALLADGGSVRALVRPGRTAVAGSEGVELTDVTAREELARGFAGAETVVHLAGRAHQPREPANAALEELRRVNVDGTLAVIEAAGDAGVRRVLIASSVKAVGEANDAPWTEETPPTPGDAYGASKLAAELVALEAGARRGVEVVAMRFPLVYGPGAPANVLRLLRLVDRGLPLPFGAIRNRRSMLSTGNLAAAVRALIGAPGIGGEIFFLADGRDLSTPELVRTIAAALGRPARLVPVPVVLLRAGGAFGSLLARFTGFPITSAEVARLTGSLTVSTAKLAERTGFRSPGTSEEGWAETAAWYRRGGG